MVALSIGPRGWLHWALVVLSAGLLRYHLDRELFKNNIDHQVEHAKGRLPSGKAKLREDLIRLASERLTRVDYVWTWAVPGHVHNWLDKNCWTPIRGALREQA
jgi:hypothetical protein